MKNASRIFAHFFILSLIILHTNSSQACTAFLLKTTQGVVTGRSLDYSQPSVYETRTYQIGENIHSLYKSPLGDKPISWKVKHEFITIVNVLSQPDTDKVNAQGNEHLVAFEGMNKAGISISGNLANAEYPYDDLDKPTITSDDIVNYILAQASSLDEARKLFTSVNIDSHWQYHYIVFDADGNSLVVEFVNEKVRFFENKTRILTNNPGLDFHLSNLNNFSNLKTYNFESIVATSGNQFHGAGMYGLPGDWMSPNRFIRGYFMIKEGEKFITNTQEALGLASKIINSVSLIKGIDLGISEISDPIYTQLQILKDVKNNKIYLKEYNDLEWKIITY